METDETGWIAGGRCVEAGLLAKDDETARSLFRAACRYYSKASGPAGRLNAEGRPLARDTDRGLVQGRGAK